MSPVTGLDVIDKKNKYLALSGFESQTVKLVARSLYQLRCLYIIICTLLVTKTLAYGVRYVRLENSSSQWATWAMKDEKSRECYVVSCASRYGSLTTMRARYTLRAPYTLSSTVQFNCVKKTARKTELNVLWHSTGFPSSFVSFFCQFCVSFCACDYGG